MKKKILFNRIISCCMAFMMVFTMLPDTARAEGVSGNDRTVSENITEPEETAEKPAEEPIEEPAKDIEISFVMDGKTAVSAGTTAETMIPLADSGNKLMVKEGDMVYFTLTAEKYYKVEQAALGEKELLADGDGIYSFVPDEEEAASVTVASAVDRAQCSSIIFSKDWGIDRIEAVPGDGDSIFIEDKEQGIWYTTAAEAGFCLFLKEGFELDSLSLGGEEQNIEDFLPGETTYFVNFTELAEGDSPAAVHISMTTQEPAAGEVFPAASELKATEIETTVCYPADILEVKVRTVGGYDEQSGNLRKESETTDGIATDKYFTEEGAFLKISVRVKDNYRFAAESFTYEGENTYISYLTAAENKALTLTAQEDCRVTARKGNILLKASPEKNMVSKNDTVTVSLLKGSEAAAFESASVSAAGVVFEEGEQPSQKEDSKEVIFTVPQKAAGKKITLTLTYRDGGESKSISYVLAVEKTLTRVSAPGIKDGKAEQVWRTVCDYKVSLTGSKDYTVLKAAVTALDGAGEVGTAAWFELESGNIVLKLETPDREEEAVVTITSSAELDAEGREKELLRFTVVSKKPELKIKKVENSQALCQSITLKLTSDFSPSGEAVDSAYYYRIEVTPEEGEKKPIAAKREVYYRLWRETSQTEKFVLCSRDDGKEWNYNFKVNLIQSTELSEEKVSELNTVCSGEVIEKDFATRDIYYEDKLTLVNKTTTLYTGQKDVLVAVPKFSKNATYQYIDGAIEVYNSKGEPTSKIRGEASPEGVIVRVNTGTPAGKYTIHVSANGPGTMYLGKASVTIQVVKGIEKLKTNCVKDAVIFKEQRKAASYPIQVIYNDGIKEDTPKTKKVSYDLLGYDAAGNRWTQEALPAGIAKYVTVKNGKITIHKDYKVSPDKAENQFKVRATAGDYTTAGYADKYRSAESGVFTISGEKTGFGRVYLASKLSDIYTVNHRTSFKASEISRLRLIVVKEGIEEKAKYIEEELVDYNLFDVKSSNKNLLASSGKLLKCSGVGKNIKLTATAKDGSRQSAGITIDVTWDTAAAIGVMGFEPYTMDDVRAVYDESDGMYHYSNPLFPYMAFQIGVKKSETALDFSPDYSGDIYNFSVSVKGGKIIRKEGYDVYYIKTTAAKTTVTITDKQNGNRKRVYTLIDDAQTAAAAKAPAVTAKNVLYAGGEEQTITYAVKNNQYDYAMVARDLFSTNIEDLFIREEFEVIPVREDGTFDITCYAEKAGSYPVSLTFGTSYADGGFKPQTRKLMTKITAKALPDFVPSSSYTMDDTEGCVTLTGTPSAFTEGAYGSAKVLNANINGKANRFSEYFKAEGGKLIRKQPVKEAAKEDLTGYIQYFNTRTQNNKLVKVTVKIKGASYKASDIKVINGKDSLIGYTTITEGRNAVAVSRACPDMDSWAGIITGVDVTEDGRVKITGNAEKLPAGTYKIGLYVIPRESPYDEENMEWETYKKAGIKTTVKFTVLDGAKTKNKVKFQNKDLKVSVSQEHYDMQRGEWDVYIPYSIAAEGAEADAITWADSSRVPDYLTIKKSENDNQAVITLNKEKLLRAGKGALGKKKAYKAAISFKNNAAAEEVSITVTPPAKLMDYSEAAEKVMTEAGRLLGEEIPNCYNSQEAVKDYIISRCQAAISAESDAVIGMAVTAFEEAKPGVTGSLTGQVYVSDNNNEQSVVSTLSVKFTIAAQEMPEQTFLEAVDAVKAAMSAYKADSLKTEMEIRKEIIQTASNAVTSPDIRVSVEKIEFHPATEQKEAVITVSIVLTQGIFRQDSLKLNVKYAAKESNDIS